MVADIVIDQSWFVNLHVKYFDIDTTRRFKGTAVGRAKIDADIDPFVWRVSIGHGF